MGYKMKHKKGDFPFKSPAKVSDADVVKAQASLDKTELDFREPGWAKVAAGAHKSIKETLSLGMLKDKKKNGKGKGKGNGELTSGNGGKPASVTQITKEMEVDKLEGGGVIGDVDMEGASMYS